MSERSTGNTRDVIEEVIAEFGGPTRPRLEHSAGGITTRDDRNDLGVPMVQGSGDEPVGPEDALGAGPKRGDYTGRV